MNEAHHGPGGFSEAGIATRNLSTWIEFLTTVGGYQPLWEGPTPASMVRSWGLPAEVEHSLGDEQVSTREGGSGLGLAIVTRVARAHEGSVEVTRPGIGGTILRMVLARRAPATGQRGVT